MVILYLLRSKVPALLKGSYIENQAGVQTGEQIHDILSGSVSCLVYQG